MPITKGAEKSLRTSKRKRVFNIRRFDAMRKQIKIVRKMVEAGKTKEANAELREVYKVIDKAAKRGIIKQNTASRKKSRISAFIKRSGS
jgi:small subunit ribosomal protein S20